MARVLVVEDNALIACDLYEIIDGAGHVVVGVVATVTEAQALLERCDAALLDVDVRDGKTFHLATSLARSGRRFMFVTGSLPQDVPPTLNDATFLQKPYREADIRRWLSGADDAETSQASATFSPAQAPPLPA
jgi:CheY-like chemotaxis protein